MQPCTTKRKVTNMTITTEPTTIAPPVTSTTVLLAGAQVRALRAALKSAGAARPGVSSLTARVHCGQLEVQVISRKTHRFSTPVDAPDVRPVPWPSDALARGKGDAEIIFALDGETATVSVTRDGYAASFGSQLDGDTLWDPFPVVPQRCIPAQCLGSVMHAISTDLARPILTCVYVDGERVTATDAYRLARQGWEWPSAQGTGPNPPKPFMLPGAMARVAVKVAGDLSTIFAGADSETVTVRANGEHLSYTGHAPAVLGTYPNVNQVIPDLVDMDPILTVTDAPALHRALGAITPSHVKQGTALRFEQGETVAIFRYGDNHVAVPFSGTVARTFGIDPRYLRDMIAELRGPIELLASHDERCPEVLSVTKPFRVTVVNGDRLVMPVRLT